MKRLPIAAALLISLSGLILAQMGTVFDWSTFGGDAQRTGWEKTDNRFRKEQVKDFQLIWKFKPENSSGETLLPPVIIGRFIGYRGFKELAFMAGTNNNLYVMDSDLERMYWQKHFEPPMQKTSDTNALCPGGLTAMPTLNIVTIGRGGRGARGARGAATPAPVPPPARGSATASPPPPARGTLPLGAARPVNVLTSDGKLHRLNVPDGTETLAPINFLPANARASNLNISNGVLYTTTSANCGGAPNAVWALDLGGVDPQATPKVTSFASGGGSFATLGGVAIGTDGTIYASIGDGPSNAGSKKFSNAVVALAPKDLKLKQYFAPNGGNAASRNRLDMNVTTPVIFSWHERDLLVTAGADGRLYLLDAATMGGSNHRTALYQTPPVVSATSADHGIWGGLSSWEDAGGTRWIAAPVWGALATGGPVKSGAIVTFKLEEKAGKPVLTPAWVSRDLPTPTPPVIANGVVFVLSNGEFTRQVKDSGGTVTLEQRANTGTHATLYALDAATGDELYSTANQVAAPGNLTGLTIANGRLYFGTNDGTLWAFGNPLEH